MLYLRTLLLLIIICSIINCINAELITLSLMGAAFMAGGWYKWDVIKDNSYCQLTECCNAKYVPYDLESK